MYISIPAAIFFLVVFFVGGFLLGCILFSGKEIKEQKRLWVVMDDDPEESLTRDNKPHWKLEEKDID